VRLLAVVGSIALGLAVMSGCTTTTASVARGYAGQVEAGIQMWDDNAIAGLQKVFCAQPYSAIQRHPEIQPGAIALCGSLANTTALDPNQVQLMLNIAKQLGYPGAGVPAPSASAASGAK
jgi:uncharacterized protein YceK